VTSNVIQLRDEYRSGERQPLAVLVDPAELERLQQVEADLSRPIVELARELAYLRTVAEAAAYDMRKVAEHERRGYDHIKVGAFKATREALEAKP
jgi:hypothetical protein